jgi:hypothetical protein
MLLPGNMTVGVHRDALILRVDPGQHETLLREPGARVFDLSGRPMKVWCRSPDRRRLPGQGRRRRRRRRDGGCRADRAANRILSGLIASRATTVDHVIPAAARKKRMWPRSGRCWCRASGLPRPQGVGVRVRIQSSTSFKGSPPRDAHLEAVREAGCGEPRPGVDGRAAVGSPGSPGRLQVLSDVGDFGSGPEPQISKIAVVTPAGAGLRRGGRSAPPRPAGGWPVRRSGPAW